MSRRRPGARECKSGPVGDLPAGSAAEWPHEAWTFGQNSVPARRPDPPGPRVRSRPGRAPARDLKVRLRHIKRRFLCRRSPVSVSCEVSAGGSTGGSRLRTLVLCPSEGRPESRPPPPPGCHRGRGLRGGSGFRGPRHLVVSPLRRGLGWVPLHVPLLIAEVGHHSLVNYEGRAPAALD